MLSCNKITCNSSYDQKWGHFSVDMIYAACRRETHLWSASCCTNTGCPASEGMQDLLDIYIPLFYSILLKKVSFLSRLLPGLSHQKAMHHLSPHHLPGQNSGTVRNQDFPWERIQKQDKENVLGWNCRLENSASDHYKPENITKLQHQAKISLTFYKTGFTLCVNIK